MGLWQPPPPPTSSEPIRCDTCHAEFVPGPEWICPVCNWWQYQGCHRGVCTHCGKECSVYREGHKLLAQCGCGANNCNPVGRVEGIQPWRNWRKRPLDKAQKAARKVARL